jgi:hypothetical protein
LAANQRPNERGTTDDFQRPNRAPLGAEPEQTEGPSRESFSLCVHATSGLVDSIDRIRGNAELSDLGRQRAIEKLQAERKPDLGRAAELVKREAAGIMLTLMRKTMISRVMAEWGKRRGKKLSTKKRQKMLREIGAKGGRASWAGMTAAERKTEMRRRLKKPRKR